MFGWLAIDCEGVRANLVAWVDDALPPRRAQRVGQHIATCAQCAGEATALRNRLRAQSAALRGLMAADTVDVDALWQRMRVRVAELEPAPARSGVRLGWAWRPALAAGIALLVIWGGVTTLGGDSEAVLISTGVKSPPPKLKQQPDMFKEYAVIKDLEVLERFDTADVEPILDAVTPPADQG